MTSHFIWYELMTNDIAAASAFYSHVVGWTVQESGQPGMDYRMWTIEGTAIGGLMAVPPEAAAMGARPAWLAYLNVPDVDAKVAAVTAAGGKVMVPPTDIPNIGRFALIADPQGAAIYLMTPLGDMPSTAFAPGKTGHGGWHELHTTDNEAAINFYHAQFGFTQSGAMDMGPMGTYRLFNAEGSDSMLGGMMNNPALPHPAWLYYFCVPDINAAKSRLESSGGTVLNGPHEVPGGGWIIQARDPQGAMFALVGANLA